MGKKKKKSPEAEGEPGAAPDLAGARLRAARTGRGLGMEEAAEATKIAVRILRAIENHDYEALPADTFTRGFLGIYAEHVGLEPEEITALFFQQRDEAVPEAARRPGTGQPLKPKKMAEPTQISSLSTALLTLALIFVALTAFCLSTSWNPLGFLFGGGKTGEEAGQWRPLPRHEQPPSQIAPPAPVDHAAVQDEQDGSVPGNEAAPDETLAPEAQAPEPQAPDAAQAPGSGLSGDSPAPAREEAGEPPGERAATAPPRFLLGITFTRDTWVEHGEDGAGPTRLEVKAGETLEIQARKALEVRFGHADSAALRLNGLEIPFPETREGGVPVLNIPASP